jgi:MFS family permease
MEGYRLNLPNRVLLTASQYVSALSYRDYRLMWMGTMSAGAADWALIVARGTLVFSLSDSSRLVGLVTFAAMAPLFFIPPFAGLLADRVDRRKLLTWIFAFQVITNVILAALAITGFIEIWQIIVLSFVNGINRAVQMPTSQALVPNLVPSDKLINAVTLSSATLHGSRLIGPLLIAPLVLTAGTGWAFALSGLLYALSMVFIMQIHTISTGVLSEGLGIMRNLIVGLEFIYHHRLLKLIVFLTLLHCSLSMAFESLLPVMSHRQWDAGETGFAYIMMAVGAGAFVGVVAIAGVQSTEMRGKLLLWLGVASGFGPLGLAVAGNQSIALVVAALMGGVQAGFMTLILVIIQTIVPDGIRGRVSSIYLLHVGGMMAVFNLIYGNLAEIFNPAAVLGSAGLLFVLVMAVSFLWAPMRRLYFFGLQA